MMENWSSDLYASFVTKLGPEIINLFHEIGISTAYSS